MKTRTVLAIALAVSWATASARDYMGMEPIIVDAKEIEGVTSESGETIKILLRAEDTAGQYTVISDRFADQTSVGLHKHDWHDEAFYVIRGSYSIVNGDENVRHTVTEDTMVFTPRGTVHAWTALEPDSKFILIYTPGGWEHYFESVGQLTEEQRNDEEFMEEYRLSYDSIYFQ